MKMSRSSAVCRRARLFAGAATALVLVLAAAGPASAGTERSLRILGGAPAAIAEVPWHVALAYDSTRYGGNGHQRYLCNGALVAPTVVLTAAHCVDGHPFPELGFNQAGHIEAITGRGTLSATDGQALPVTEIHYLARLRRGGKPVFVLSGGQKLFTRKRAHYDLAILRLAGPSVATPVQIAGPRETRTWRPGVRGIVGGWGHTARHSGGNSDQLITVPLRRVADSRCARTTVTWRRAIKLCAGDGRTRATCTGDSGGPLAVPVRTRAGRSIRLVGITNYGSHGRGRCSRVATTFARVAGSRLRAPLRDKIREIAAVDVVGSGARPLR